MPVAGAPYEIPPVRTSRTRSRNLNRIGVLRVSADSSEASLHDRASARLPKADYQQAGAEVCGLGSEENPRKSSRRGQIP
jgi:hypothetical protein